MAAPLQKPSLPWKTRLSISLLTAVTTAACHADGTVNRRLVRFLDYQTPPTSTPVNSVSSADIVVDPSRNLWFRLFCPTTTASLPVIVFFHGGGFNFLSAATASYNAVCRRFARTIPAYIVSVNYRLAPEHRYPAQHEDGFDVLKYLDENGDNVLPKTADLSQCFFAGDSAGANLAHYMTVRLCQNNFKVLKLKGLVAIQPFFGGEERTKAEMDLKSPVLVSLPRTDWCWKYYMPDGADRDHEAVNVSGPNAMKISGLDFPESLVIVGGFDPLKDWQRRYFNWLKTSGKEASLIEYPNMIHAFYLFPEMPESGQLMDQVKEFITKCLSKV